MKRFIITLLLFCILLHTVGNSVSNMDIRSIHEENTKYYTLYTEILESIKKHEGLSLVKYYCPGGYLTIGYGHQYKNYDNIGDTITIEQADSLLIADLEYNIAAVEKLTELNRYKDTGKVLAMAHFTFNIGEGNFANSSVLKNIRNNQSIEDELRRWVHIKKEFSLFLLKRRNYEIGIYKTS